jgi:hypothetical protein
MFFHPKLAYQYARIYFREIGLIFSSAERLGDRELLESSFSSLRKIKTDWELEEEYRRN